MINENHKGRPNVRDINKCLEALNTYGISPNKFVVIRNKKRDEIKNENPFKWLPKVRVACSCIKFKGIWIAQKLWLGFTQNVAWVINRVRPVSPQNTIGDIEYIELVCGSKEEKISVIIKAWKISIGCFEGS